MYAKEKGLPNNAKISLSLHYSCTTLPLLLPQCFHVISLLHSRFHPFGLSSLRLPPPSHSLRRPHHEEATLELLLSGGSDALGLEWKSQTLILADLVVKGIMISKVFCRTLANMRNCQELPTQMLGD